MNKCISLSEQNWFNLCECYRSDKGFAPPGSNDWVDHIRNTGNEANHEIKIMNKQDAEDLINFVEMLLKFIYEYPGKILEKESP